jgi:hypothetical protein
MNAYAHFCRLWAFGTLTTCFCASALAGGTTNAAAPSANPAEPQVGQSVFLQPADPKQGKDPFYPLSLRPYPAPGKIKTAPAVGSGLLMLKGISGTRQHPLCIINNRTFEAGEEGEILTSAGKTKIRCVEIKADSVIIDIGGERQELRLPRGV